MVDTLTAPQRSERMSRIRSTNTKPEVALRKALHRLGFRFRLHGRRLPGKPDILLPRYRTAIFVHGCFWHRHEGCKIATTPKSNTEFWVDKFDRNTERDSTNQAQLKTDGWKVIVVWECELKSDEKASAAASMISDETRTLLCKGLSQKTGRTGIPSTCAIREREVGRQKRP